MRMRAVAIGVVAAGLGIAAPASARQFRVEPVMLPYVLQYAACANDPKIADFDARIARCSRARAGLALRMDAVMKTSFEINKDLQRVTFQRALDGVEAKARLLIAEDRTPSAAFVRYVRCIGDVLASDKSFQAGNRVMIDGALDVCLPLRKLVAEAAADPADTRSRGYLVQLDRFWRGAGDSPLGGNWGGAFKL